MPIETKTHVSITRHQHLGDSYRPSDGGHLYPVLSAVQLKQRANQRRHMLFRAGTEP